MSHPGHLKPGRRFFFRRCRGREWGGRLGLADGDREESRHCPELGLQFDGARGGVEMMVLDGAPVDDFELAQQHVQVAAVVGGEGRLDFTDAGADGFRFEQPRVSNVSAYGTN